MTRRDRMIVAVAAMLALVGAGWMFVVAPKRTESSALSTQIASAQQERDALATKATGDRSAEQTYAADAAAVAALGKALPATDDTASLLYQLDAAAGSSRVKLKSITPAPVTAPVAGAVPLPAGVTEVSLSLGFEGRFADLERFLRRVRSFTSVSGDRVAVRGRLLNVKSLHLSATGATPGQVSATMDAAVYIDASAPSPATPATAAAGATAAAPGATASAPPVTPAVVGAGG